MKAGRRDGLLRRNRNFRLVWIGEVAGGFGEAVTLLALPLIAVSTLRANTFEVGLLAAVPWLPWLLIALPAGAWVDRSRHRSVMLWADVVSFILFASIPVAAWIGMLTIGQLLGVALIAGTAAVFFRLAYSAYLPVLLVPEDRPEGNSKLQGSAAAAQIVGVGFGGLLVQWLGGADGILVVVGSFLVSFLCLARIRHLPAEAPTSGTPRRAMRKEIGEGLMIVKRDPYLRTLALFGATSNLALSGYQAVLVVFLVRDVGLSAGTIGAAATIAGFGSVLGAVVSIRVSARLGSARAYLLFNLGLPTLALLIPLASRGIGLILPVIGYAAVSFGVVAGNVLRTGFIQEYCPPEKLGRINATSSFLNYGTMPLGAILGGLLGGALGNHAALWILTAGIPLSAVLLLLSPIRRYRDFPASLEPVRDRVTV